MNHDSQPERPWETPASTAARAARDADDRRLTRGVMILGVLAALPLLALGVVILAVAL